MGLFDAITDMADALSEGVETVSSGLKEALGVDDPAPSAESGSAATGGGGAATPSNAASRIVEGSGGYVYEQLPDGNIIILSGPGGKRAVARGTKAWQAITDEIGAYGPAEEEDEIIIMDEEETDDDDPEEDEILIFDEDDLDDDEILIFDEDDSEEDELEQISDEEAAAAELFWFENEDPYDLLDDTVDGLNESLGLIYDKASNGRHTELAERGESLNNKYPEMMRLLGKGDDASLATVSNYLEEAASVRRQLQQADFDDERKHWEANVAKREALLDSIAGVPAEQELLDRFDSIVANAEDHYLYAMANLEWDQFALECKNYVSMWEAGLIDEEEEDLPEFYSEGAPDSEFPESGEDVPDLISEGLKASWEVIEDVGYGVWRVGESINVFDMDRNVEIGMENERLERLLDKLLSTVGGAAVAGGEALYKHGVFRTISELVVIYETMNYIATLAPEDVKALAAKGADKITAAAEDWAKKKIAQKVGKSIAKTVIKKSVVRIATNQIAKTAIAKTFTRKMATAVATSETGVGNLITAYGLMGFVQKMSRASQRLKALSPWLHNQAVRADVDLLWVFIEPILEQIKDLVIAKVDELLESI